jgi:AraC family transcriptional regulator
MSVSVTLQGSPDRRLVLSHYDRGEECQPHSHRWAQVSLLLAGGYVEESADGRADADGPRLTGKPGGFEHQNRFSDAGALILTLNLETAPHLERYFVTSPPRDRPGPECLQAIGVDGAGLPAGGVSAPGRPGLTMHPWLIEARTRLLARSDLSIAALARSHGQHPVRFAQLFREAFTVSPSALRQNGRAARAIGRLIRSDLPLAEVAVSEGFADQAHLGRTINQVTGLSPGRLRRLFATL